MGSLKLHKSYKSLAKALLFWECTATFGRAREHSYHIQQQNDKLAHYHRYGALTRRGRGSAIHVQLACFRDVLQLRASKQDKVDLFYLEAFIYGSFSDIAPSAIS